jgi:hypothetical protein
MMNGSSLMEIVSAGAHTGLVMWSLFATSTCRTILGRRVILAHSAAIILMKLWVHLESRRPRVVFH